MPESKYQEITKAILENSLIVFDTSALIELYFYPKQIMDILQEKVFSVLSFKIPHHAYYEYYGKKDEKKNAACGSYNNLSTNGPVHNIEQTIEKSESNLKTLVEQTKITHKHPYFEEELFGNLADTINKFKEDATAQLDKIKLEIGKKVKEIEESDDLIFKIISDHFAIGREYSFSEKLEIAKEGAIRFDLDIPPGWADARGKNAKEGLQKYGDLFIWKQICEISKTDEKDIILITKDVAKEDWCHRIGTEINIEKPRIELIDEMKEISGQKFYMLSVNQLVYHTSKELGYEIDTSLLSEVDSTESVKIIHFETDNLDSTFWGIHQEIKGTCHVSKDFIKFYINELKLTNTKGTDFHIKTINANIGFNNQNNRWEILKRGNKFDINKDCYNQGESIVITDFELNIDRSQVPDLKYKWIIFQIETLNENRTSYGTMYNQWREFSIE